MIANGWTRVLEASCLSGTLRLQERSDQGDELPPRQLCLGSRTQCFAAAPRIDQYLGDHSWYGDWGAARSKGGASEGAGLEQPWRHLGHHTHPCQRPGTWHQEREVGSLEDPSTADRHHNRSLGQWRGAWHLRRTRLKHRRLHAYGSRSRCSAAGFD